jgi:HPt (histidine-containing phosphotransfer) domain-containing protein
MFQPRRNAAHSNTAPPGSDAAPLRPEGAGQGPAAPAGGLQLAIDLEHLDRMTFGERKLVREVLRLFVRQAEILLRRMERASPSSAALLAHTLKGSARGVGAWTVATSAEEYELAAQQSDPEKLAQAFEQLCRAIHEARSAIGAVLAAQ